MKIWLNTELNGKGISEGDSFVFVVNADNIVTGVGDDFVSGLISGGSVSSGAIAINIETTSLSFNIEPSAYGTVNVALSTVPVVVGVDVNGNIDTDFTGTVTLTNSENLGMTYIAGVTNGLVTFNDLLFTASGTVKLVATCTDVVTLVNTTVESTSITVEAYDIPSNIENSNFYINQLIFEDINNTSGYDNGYGSYIDLTTSVKVGATYDIDLGLYNNTNSTGYVFVWIDWDHDYDFDDETRIELGSVSKSSSIQALSNTIDIPQTATSGVTRMRVLFTTDNTSSSSEDGNIAETEDYTVIVVENGWLGNTTSWNDINNWITGVVPNSTSDVYIPLHPTYGDRYPIISSVVTSKGLEIASGATVTLNAGADVSIAGNLTTNGGLIINNTQDSPVSVKIDGESDGYATETWKLDNDRWWYIGHSVYNDNTNLYNYYYNSVGSPAGNDFRLYYWNASNQGWSRITSSSYSYNPVEGYAFMQQYNKDGLSYQGEFNNDENYTYTTSVKGWHHLANPYPCYIDISQASLVNFTPGYKIYTTDTNGDRVYQGAYWGSGEVLIGMSGGTNYIAPGQGFWMYTSDTSGGSVTISKSACVTKATAESGGGSVSLKSTSSATHNYLKMSLTNEVSNGEMYLLFNENGSDSFTRYDFKKKFVGGNVADMYMVKDDEYVDINVLPTITSSVIVPVGYKVSTSGMTEMTINTSDVSFIDEAYDVFLDDLQEPSVSINLRKQSSYTFTPEVAQTDGRFQLRIVPSMTTGIDDEEDVVSDESVSVYTLKQTATVKVTDEVLYQKDGVIEVYDISGQLVKQLELTDVETTFTLPQANTVYVISVKAGNSSYQQKVVTQ